MIFPGQRFIIANVSNPDSNLPLIYENSTFSLVQRSLAVIFMYRCAWTCLLRACMWIYLYIYIGVYRQNFHLRSPICTFSARNSWDGSKELGLGLVSWRNCAGNNFSQGLTKSRPIDNRVDNAAFLGRYNRWLHVSLMELNIFFDRALSLSILSIHFPDQRRIIVKFLDWFLFINESC